MLQNLISALKIVFALLCFALGASAQTDMNKLLASEPLETVRYNYVAGILGVRIGNVQIVEKRASGDDFVYTATVQFPDGIVRSTAIVDAKTLHLKRGVEEQFDKTVEYEIADGKITGTERRGKKAKNFSIAATGDVYGLQVYHLVFFQTLPLADGYSGGFKVFDPLKKEIRDAQFKVVGSDTVFIAGNRFDCFKIEGATNAGGDGKYTALIDKRTRRLIQLKGVAGFGKMFGAEAQIMMPERKL